MLPQLASPQLLNFASISAGSGLMIMSHLSSRQSPLLPQSTINRISDLDDPIESSSGVSAPSSSSGGKNNGGKNGPPRFPRLPPIKINDYAALLTEFSGIWAGTLILAIYDTVQDTTFPGWLTPITADAMTSPRLAATLVNALLLSCFWFTSYWAGSNLQQPMYRFRLENVLEFSLVQWINVINQFIAVKFLYAYVNGVPVVGIEYPLISAFVGVFVARLLYYQL
jgi:hypothetical protein